MNLYFRLLIVFIKILFTPKKHYSEEATLEFRAYPPDCDPNLHMTNARYLGLADLGRVHLLGQLGILFPLLKRRTFPVNHAADITFIRPIKPFQKLTLKSRLLTWDEKYWYTEQKFEVGKKLHAISMTRGVFLCGRDIVPVDEVALLLGDNVQPPPQSETIRQWKQLLATKKNDLL
jgi:acyl-CoA thioesterase FadM